MLFEIMSSLTVISFVLNFLDSIFTNGLSKNIEIPSDNGRGGLRRHRFVREYASALLRPVCRFFDPFPDFNGRNGPFLNRARTYIL